MPIGVVAAGVGAAGMIGSAIIGNNAASDAADAQVQGDNQAAQVNREGLAQQQKQYDTSRQDALSVYNQNRTDAQNVYNTSRSDLAPYRDVGSNALLALSDQLGIARPAGQANVNTGNPQFHTDPGYQFAFDQGLKAVDARFPGMSKSGAKAQALTQFGQGQADQQYDNWLSRLSGLASAGQTATGQSATLGANFTSANNAAGANLTSGLNSIGQQNSQAIGAYSQNTGNILQNAAAARASGYVGGANAITGAIGGGVNNLLAAYGSGAFGGNSGYGFPDSVNVTPPLWNDL